MAEPSSMLFEDETELKKGVNEGRNDDVTSFDLYPFGLDTTVFQSKFYNTLSEPTGLN